ncbi:MAG: methyl-accepting chemotaxis protein [Candidatus Manganitrophaceae bacterium]
MENQGGMQGDDSANRREWKRGLRVKSILFFSIFTIMMSGTIGLTIFIQVKNAFEETLQKRGLALANTIATNGAFAVSIEDKQVLGQILLGAAHEPDIAYVAVLNREGKVIIHSDPRENGKILADPLSLQALRAVQPTAYRYKSKTGNHDDVVAPVRLVSMKSHEGDRVGVVRVGISLKRVESESRRLLFLSLSLLGGWMMAGLWISLVWNRTMMNRLERLIQVAVKMSDGDFREKIDVVSGDEVGVLGNLLSKIMVRYTETTRRIRETMKEITDATGLIFMNAKKMNDGGFRQAQGAEKTSSSIEEMNASVKSIAENIEGLSTAAGATSSSLVEMSAAINQVANHTTILSTSVEETASALLEMSNSEREVVEHIDSLSMSVVEMTASMNEVDASIREVERNARESAQMTEKVSRDAVDLGVGAIEKTIKGMEKIRKTVEKSAGVINQLDERAERIGKILTVIDEVTRQTNLLALNAAILASQSGEQGKGFDVVAGEIKNLADRTSLSTKEIAQLIRDVQSEAKDAVVSIREGAKSVEEGVLLSINARKLLNMILESSKRSSVMSREIEKATNEQVQAVHQVAQAMEKVSAMVHQIHLAMQEQQKGIDDITAASEKMRTITRQVKLSTEEQADGSKQISNALENIALRIQQISRGMNEHQKGGEIIVKSILEIEQVTQVNNQMTLEMNLAIEGLAKQARLLKDEIDGFKV